MTQPPTAMTKFCIRFKSAEDSVKFVAKIRSIFNQYKIDPVGNPTTMWISLPTVVTASWLCSQHEVEDAIIAKEQP